MPLIFQNEIRNSRFRSLFDLDHLKVNGQFRPFRWRWLLVLLQNGSRNIRQERHLARLGDEFAILLEDHRAKKSVEVWLIGSKSTARTFTYYRVKAFVTASIGIVEWDLGKLWCSRCDLAMRILPCIGRRSWEKPVTRFLILLTNRNAVEDHLWGTNAPAC